MSSTCMNEVTRPQSSPWHTQQLHWQISICYFGSLPLAFEMAARNRKDAPSMCTPPKFNSSPLKNGGKGRQILSYWVSVTLQGQTVKLREGIFVAAKTSPTKNFQSSERMPLFVAVRAKRPRRPEIQKFMKKIHLGWVRLWKMKYVYIIPI